MDSEIEGLLLCLDRYDLEEGECVDACFELWLALASCCCVFVCVWERAGLGVSGLDATGDRCDGGVYGIRMVGSYESGYSCDVCGYVHRFSRE